MTTLAPPTLDDRAEHEPGSWSIHWEGDTWHETDLTGAHLAWLAMLDGEDTWAHVDLSDLSDLNPVRGPVRLMSLIVCCVAIRDELTDDQILADLFRRVRSTPIDTLLNDSFTIH